MKRLTYGLKRGPWAMVASAVLTLGALISFPSQREHCQKCSSGLGSSNHTNTQIPSSGAVA